MRKTLLILGMLTSAFCAMAQNDLIMSQYLHNRYAINPAFGGSHECFSLFGSYRKQWAGIENTPQSMLFALHTPLKRENIALGLQVFNQSIHQSSSSGALLSLGYRVRTDNKQWLTFSLQPGVALRSTNWTKVRTAEAGDEVFGENVSKTNPLLGFGAAWYGPQHFVGASVVSFFVADDFANDGSFSPDNATYILTGGYLFGNNQFSIQPSALLSYQQEQGVRADGTASFIFSNMVWVSAGYRTTGEITAGAAVQALPQLKVAYSYDYNSGNLRGQTSGSHEVSLQFDLIFKTDNVGPRFF